MEIVADSNQNSLISNNTLGLVDSDQTAFHLNSIFAAKTDPGENLEKKPIR